MGNPRIQYFLIFVITINLISYMIMWRDKQAAINYECRMAEKKIFSMTFIGGSFGILLGTKFPIYNKSIKSIFQLGIPCIILAQFMFAILLFADKI